MMRSRALALMLCAVASLGLYAATLLVVRDLEASRPSHAWEMFGWVQPLPRWREDHAALHAAAAGPMLLLLLSLFAVYGLATVLVAGRRSTTLTAIIFIAGGLFLFVQLFGSALLSNDVYSYIMHGRIFAVHASDPHTQSPSQFRADPYFRLVEWRNTPSSRGPLWTLVAAGLASVGGERIGVTVLLFRVVGLLAALVTAGLVWAWLSERSPERANQGLVLFLWNPLVVLESGLSGHSEAVMAALLALALWLHRHGRRALVPTALVLASLVKFIVGLILPLYVLLILRAPLPWKRRARDLATGAALGVVVLLVVHLVAGVRPDAPVSQAMSAEGERYTNSLHELAFTALRLYFGESSTVARAPWQRDDWIGTRANSSNASSAATTRANFWLRAVTWSAFGVFFLYAAWRVVDERTFLVWSTATLLTFYWLVGTWIQPWYVIWALALAAHVPMTGVAQLTALLSATIMSVYITGGYESDSPLWWLNDYRSIPVFVLPLVLMAVFRVTQFLEPRRLLSAPPGCHRPAVYRAAISEVDAGSAGSGRPLPG